MTAHGQALTPGDLEVLEFERATWKYPGRREAVIRERFGISLTRHLQRVTALIDHPQAQAYNAQLVRQLRDRRDQLVHARRNGFGATS